MANMGPLDEVPVSERKRIEPGICSPDLPRPIPENALLTSMAISLKRIADSLDNDQRAELLAMLKEVIASNSDKSSNILEKRDAGAAGRSAPEAMNVADLIRHVPRNF